MKDNALDLFIDYLIDKIIIPKLKEGGYMWIQERKTLINRLVKLYPYPREWFEGLTTAQLNTMYNRKKKQKNNAAKLNTKEPIKADHHRVIK